MDVVSVDYVKSADVGRLPLFSNALSKLRVGQLEQDYPHRAIHPMPGLWGLIRDFEWFVPNRRLCFDSLGDQVGDLQGSHDGTRQEEDCWRRCTSREVWRLPESLLQAV